MGCHWLYHLITAFHSVQALQSCSMQRYLFFISTVFILFGCLNSDDHAMHAQHLLSELKQGNYNSLLGSTITPRGEAYHISFVQNPSPICDNRDSTRISAWIMQTSIDPVEVSFFREHDSHQEEVARITKQFELLYETDSLSARQDLLQQFHTVVNDYKNAEIFAVRCSSWRTWIHITNRHVLAYGPLTKFYRALNEVDLGEGWYYYELEEGPEFSP